MKYTKSVLCKLIVFCLVVALAFPTSVSAAKNEEVIPFASYYLDGYNAYICDMGRGEMQIWFDVMGTGYMDEIGVLSIQLYESTDNATWKRVKTFLPEDNPEMMAYNAYDHFAHVTYHGIAGRYYKARVCVWAGKDGKGDSQYRWAYML